MKQVELPLRRVREVLAKVGGSTPPTRAFFRSARGALVLGAWWWFLLLLALAFAGRATRFIYVDF